MSDLSIGSHLVTPRIGYQHHGIYIGNEQVIHFTSNSQIETISLSEFTDGNGCSIQKYHSKFNRKEIIDRAKSRLGDDNYNVIFNNCEHFVSWCIHDEHRSEQVRNVTLGSSVSGITAQSLIATPTVAGLTLAEMTAASSMTTSFTLLSTTPILPAALVGFGVFKLVQFLSD